MSDEQAEDTSEPDSQRAVPGVPKESHKRGREARVDERISSAAIRAEGLEVREEVNLGLQAGRARDGGVHF